MLLSYSSMRMFLTCPRSWALAKLDKIEIPGQDNIPLIRGNAFHEAVEKDPSVALQRTDLNEFDKKLVYQAAIKYNEMALTFPPATMKEVKIINEEHGFIGYKDSVTINENNTWLIGEMKTSVRLDPIEWATYQVSQQVGLYKAMSGEWCKENYLSQEDFSGCSFKKIVFGNKRPLKGRGKNAVAEDSDTYIERVKKDIQVYHQIFDVTKEVENSAMQTFNFVKDAMKNLGDKSDRYPKNQAACKGHFGICPFFERCWQINISDTEEEENIDYD